MFAQQIGVAYNAADANLLNEWARLSQSIGWWASWDGICIVSDRPEAVHFDDQKRLHCETGMAARYRDGWGCYAWHGTAIPGEWIEKRSSLTPQVALTWNNIEQRRAACEIVGWSNILAQLDSRVIDDNGDPEIGRLIEVTLPDVGKERFIVVRCGTGRGFALPVPPNMRTAIEAQSWTWGIDKKDFMKPEVRT